MLFPLDVGTDFCFVNTASFQTMRFTPNWKSGLHTCTLCETHFSSSVTVSLCQLLLSNDDIYKYVSPPTPPPHINTYTHTHKHAHTYMHIQTHTQLLTRKNDWVPSLETAEQKGKWLTSGLSLSFLIELSQFFFFRVHCLLASPVTHLFIHALPPFSLSLSHALSPSASPVLCHSSPPALLSRHSPPSLFFSSSGDGDWQMIWQRKTSGEKKLTSPSRLTSTPRPPSALPPPLTAWGKLSFFI